MFGDKDIPQTKLDSSNEALSKEGGSSSSFKVNQSDIHVMPEKFRMVEKAAGRSHSWLVIIVILVIGAVLVGGAIFAYQSLFNKNENQNTLATVNENENINALVNANQNANKNTNVLQNVNGNLNANAPKNYNLNIFENINSANVNANVNLNLNTNTLVPVSNDSDNDGLTDLEEALFKTQPLIKDSDNDSYLDSQELKSGYNPNGSGRIETTESVSTYTSAELNYSVLYPSSWVSSPDPNNKNGEMFTSDTAEFVEVTVYDNPSSLSARNWYISQSPNVDTSRITTVTNWDNSLTDGVKAIDGLNVYYSYDNKIYLISYNINIQQETNYKSAFEMMYKSLKIISPLLSNLNANLNTNINSNTVNLNVNF